MKLGKCACGGFLPTKASACPHCGAAVAAVAAVGDRARLYKLGAGLVAVAGGTAAAVTLAACYGPPCAANNPNCLYVYPDLLMIDAGEGGADGGVDGGTDGPVDGGADQVVGGG